MALGPLAPRRSPRPAAGTSATVTADSISRCWMLLRRLDRRRREDLVEDYLGLALVGAFGQCQLTDQNLPCLGEHALLTGGQPAILLAPPEVAHHFGHLVHIAGGELLEVGLVPARPVGRLLGVRSAQHIEDAVETLLADDVANTDDLGVV